MHPCDNFSGFCSGCWGRGLCGHGGRFDSAEDHAASGGLHGVVDQHGDFLTQKFSGPFYDYHGAVIEISHTLLRRLTGFDNPQAHGFTGQGDGRKTPADLTDTPPRKSTRAGFNSPQCAPRYEPTARTVSVDSPGCLEIRPVKRSNKPFASVTHGSSIPTPSNMPHACRPAWASCGP